MLNHVLAFDQPLVAGTAGEMDHLLDRGAKPMELLLQRGSRIGRIGGYSNRLSMASQSEQNIELQPGDAHGTCEGPTCSPLPVVKDGHAHEEGLYVRGCWVPRQSSGTLLYGDELGDGVIMHVGWIGMICWCFGWHGGLGLRC